MELKVHYRVHKSLPPDPVLIDNLLYVKINTCQEKQK
jgi:hypothetical protein